MRHGNDAPSPLAAPLANCSQAVNDPAHFKTLRAEVHQKAQMQARGTKIVQALRAVHAAELLHGLQFDNDRLLNQQIDAVFSNGCAVVHYGHAMLPRDRDAGLA